MVVLNLESEAVEQDRINLLGAMVVAEVPVAIPNNGFRSETLVADLFCRTYFISEKIDL